MCLTLECTTKKERSHLLYGRGILSHHRAGGHQNDSLNQGLRHKEAVERVPGVQLRILSPESGLNGDFPQACGTEDQLVPWVIQQGASRLWQEFGLAPQRRTCVSSSS